MNSAFFENKTAVQADSAKVEFKRALQRGSLCELRIFQKDSGEFKQTCACCKNKLMRTPQRGSSSRLRRGGGHVNSAFFKKTVESSSRLVHVVKTEWGVDANSAKGEFKQTPQRGSSCELRIFQKPNGEFQKCRVCLNSPLCF